MGVGQQFLTEKRAKRPEDSANLLDPGISALTITKTFELLSLAISLESRRF